MEQVITISGKSRALPSNDWALWQGAIATAVVEPPQVQAAKRAPPLPAAAVQLGADAVIVQGGSTSISTGLLAVPKDEWGCDSNGFLVASWRLRRIAL
jgi:hypothetical protein